MFSTEGVLENIEPKENNTRRQNILS